MVKITPSQLVTINLKFSSQAKPLKQLAFADLALNTLFFLKKEATTTEVTAEMARLLGLPGIDEKLVQVALSSLLKDGKVIPQGKKWRLSDDTEKIINKENDKSEEALQGVLRRHFPGGIDLPKLRNWFLIAASDFFGFNGAEWVKSIARNVRTSFAKPKTIRELLKPSIEAAGLSLNEGALVDGFDALLLSDDLEDLQYVTNLGFAMFSAQLVAADVGADPIAIDEIRGATFVLDTNVLFAMQLDAHRIARSINALARALNEIGAELIFLHTTKQEYTRVFAGKKNEIIALLKEYPAEVVLAAKSDFIESAFSRNCATAEDFERFFETIKSPPAQLPNGQKILQQDDQEIEQEIKKSENDVRLQESLQYHCMKLRPWWDKRPKSEMALKHDAALIRVTEHLRTTKQKTWVLSLDRSLRVCAADRAGANSIPVVFMLDGLIQILAVHSGGPSRNASDFAPLLANIILNRCTPSARTYTPQDLHWLYSIQKRVVDFSPEQIKKIANIVTQHRLTGATSDDSKLQLEINRAYQEEKEEYDRELEKAHERAREAEAETYDVRAELARYKKIKCINDVRWQLIRALLWRIPTAFIAAIIVYFFALFALPATSAGWLDWSLSIVTFIGIIAGLLWNPIKQYKLKIKKCNSAREGEVIK